jgi:peroxiredoxin
VQLHRDREKFDAAGARLVVIGQRRPRDAQAFIDQFDLDGLEILVDPGREVYAAAGAKVGTLMELLGPRSVARGIARSVKERKVQGPVQGHAAQLGGVLVIARDGTIAWSHMSEDASDYPPNEDVLAAVERARAAG